MIDIYTLDRFMFLNDIHDIDFELEGSLIDNQAIT